MPADHAATAEQSPIERPRPGARPRNLGTKVGNGRARFLGEDLRSSASRRAAELCDEYARPGGCWEVVQRSPELAPVARRIKRLAQAVVELEVAGGDRTAGRAVDQERVVALANLIERLEGKLERAAPAPKPAVATLADIVADIARSGPSPEDEAEADE